MSELRPLGRRHAWSTRFTGSGAIGQHMIVPVRRSRGFIGDPDVTMAFRFTDGTLDPVPPLAGPALTFTRSTVGTYYDELRVLQTAAIDAPRFDHDPTTGTALGLLIEESRENLILRSDQLNDAVWNVTAASIQINTDIAPDGTTTADTLVEDNTDATHRIFQSVATTAAAWTFSAYVKRVDRDWCYLRLDDSIGTPAAWFNLVTGEVGTVQSGLSGATMKALPNGYFRISVTVDVAFVGNNSPLLGMATSDGSAGYLGDGTGSMIIWGAQMELGAFATSYIPTVAVPVTRGEDLCGTADMSWLDADKGTMYFAGSSLAFSQASYRAYEIGDNTNDNRIYTYALEPGEPLAFSAAAGVTQYVLIPAQPVEVNQLYKHALAWQLNDAAFVVNGSVPATDNTVTVPIVTVLDIGHGQDSAQLNGHIAELAYANVRKSNAFLQGVT